MAEASPAQGAALPLLEARGLAAVQGTSYVLLDLDLRVSAGERVAIAGANGTGKSTLLGLLAGHRAPDAGQLRWRGVDVQALDPRQLQRRVGWLGHQPGLLLALSARENLILFAELAGCDASAARIDAVLDAVGLDSADRQRPVATYSRGMTQRAGLGRLMAVGAELWLLDEPTTGLDTDGRARLDSALGLHQRRGGALVVVSHDEAQWLAADRVLWLQQGRLRNQPAPKAAA